mgnify:CR=1 FL=1
MEKGDVYLKHVRGSRYAFNYGKLFYKYPGGAKCYASEDWEKLVEDCCDIAQKFGGRLFINEEKDMVIYRQMGGDSWHPFYIGKLDNSIEFEGIDNDPKDLKPGLFWTGFASHHGAKFHLDMKERVYFKETYYEEGVQVSKKYFVQNIDKDLVKRLYYFKQGQGSFHINEYGHIWAPVDKDVILESEDYHSDIIDVSDIQNQFRQLTDIQKHTIDKYGQPRYSRLTKRRESWFPIYIGKYTKPLKIKREERPHIIIDPDILFSE